MTECQHKGCDDPGEVERKHTESGEKYWYCEDCDPLEDDTVAYAFEEV